MKEASGTLQDSFAANMKAMNEIIAEMKEIPFLESENPKDNNPLERVEFPAEGGVLTFMGGYDLPYKGFPYMEAVETIDCMKKIGRGFLSGLYHRMKKRRVAFLSLLFLIPTFWLFKDVLRAAIYGIYRLAERKRQKPQKYSKAVRAIYLALSIPRKESASDREFRCQVRDVACMVLENDNAYRFRAQDILVEVHKRKLRRFSVLELQRLLRLMSSREKTQEIRDTWKLLEVAVWGLWVLDRKLFRMICDSIINLNLADFALDEGDKVYCTPRKDYEFGFTKTCTINSQNNVLAAGNLLSVPLQAQP